MRFLPLLFDLLLWVAFLSFFVWLDSFVFSSFPTFSSLCRADFSGAIFVSSFDAFRFRGFGRRTHYEVGDDGFDIHCQTIDRGNDRREV